MKGEIETKVYYEDTDALGTVYYANYFKYYERGRTELFGEHGHAVQDLNASGFNVLVYRVEATFRRAARLGDRLRVITELKPVESVYRLNLDQAIYRGEELINQAKVQLVCVNATGALQEFPAALRKL
jgi:tol-pal system-associated acyl-CoA thioesterase